MFVRVLINKGAGSVADESEQSDEIRDAFETVGAEARVDVVEPDAMQDTLRSWWSATPRPDVIVVAGGDGTVNCAASAAVDTDIVLSVLPLGTFNHFAKDLGIPDDLLGAAKAIVEGEERAVDVGEVNGEVFVNNSALGVYPDMVSARDRIRDARGWGKIRAVPVASYHVLKDLPVHRLTFEGSDGFQRHRVRTPFVFIGNGRYDNGLDGNFVRESMHDRTLSLVLSRATTRWRLVISSLRALVAGTRRSEELDQVDLAEVTITGRTRRLRVARDGEVGWQNLPLRYRCRPGALNVRAPSAPPAA